MTLNEYMLLMESYQLKRVEEQRKMAEQAFYNRAVKATNSKGDRYKINKLSDLFDYDKAIDDVRSQFESDYQRKSKNNNDDEIKKIIERQRKWNEYQRRKQKGSE